MKTKATITSIIIIAALSSCSTTPDASPPGPTSSAATTTPAPISPTIKATPQPEIQVPHVDLSEPGDVAATYATFLYTYDTRTDTGPSDALARIFHLCDDRLTTELAQVSSSGGADWLELARHQGYTEVSVTPIEMNAPPATQTMQWFDYEVTITWLGRDGWTGPTTTTIVSLQTTKQDDGTWLITDVTT